MEEFKEIKGQKIHSVTMGEFIVLGKKDNPNGVIATTGIQSCIGLVAKSKHAIGLMHCDSQQVLYILHPISSGI